jgi:hypothetical protein
MERLTYVRLSEFDPQQKILSIQLEGGGASACFLPGDTQYEVIGKLRALADLLERGVSDRTKRAG